ncbi:MAG: TolC family protein [Gammaproteobacteria bacterium]|nr:TolC family protein [Gammaproteobacteria bacterium]
MIKGLILAFVLFLSGMPAHAETLQLDLSSAIKRALVHDPRVSEMEALVRAARATVNEVDGYGDIQASMNTFVGFSPALKGGLFTTEDCGESQPCVNRTDRYNVLEDGLSIWNYADFRIIKPLYTFGKLSAYLEAANADVKIKQETVQLQKNDTVYELKRAYYGHLTARDTTLFLKDMKSRLQQALNKVQIWLDEEEGQVKRSDLYALQTATGIADSFIVQAEALQKISMAGIKLLADIGSEVDVQLMEKKIAPVPLPVGALDELQQKALLERPELKQLNNGLKARRALVEANKAMNRPDLFAGVSGMASYSWSRDRLDNPHVYDPFNDVGATPVVGFQWKWSGSVKNARVAKAQAELDALIEKGSFARRGIPFQVEESFKQVQAFHEAVLSLEKGSRSARRWMIATYADFEAGVEQADKIVAAFQGYVLAYTEYLETVYDYNMHVAALERAVGVVQ